MGPPGQGARIEFLSRPAALPPEIQFSPVLTVQVHERPSPTVGRSGFGFAPLCLGEKSSSLKLFRA